MEKNPGWREGNAGMKEKIPNGRMGPYCRGHTLFTPLQVLECGFHDGYDWVFANVSMTCGRIHRKKTDFWLE